MKKIFLSFILVGLITSLFAQNNTYQYDNLNRLKKVTYPNGTVIDYTYDQLGNRTSKVSVVTAPQYPDLLVQNLSLGQTTTVPGALLTSSCTVRNNGSGSAGAYFLKCYLSANTIYNSGIDIEIGSVFNSYIGALSNMVNNPSLAIPQGTAAGSWYVLFFADATSMVGESNENNNVGYLPITVVSCSNIVINTSKTDATCSQANGTANITAGGGTQPYTYNWSNGQNTTTVSGLSGGTYSVTVSDYYGCNQAASVTIISYPAPALTMTSTPAGCGGINNGSATATATGGIQPYTYLWSSGQANPTINGLSAGAYAVTVTDASSCLVSGSVTVTSPGNLSANVTSTSPSCGAGDGSLTASVNGGAQPYTYNWSNVQHSQTITGLQAGNYSLTVTDANNCSFITSVTLSSVNNMNVTFSVQHASCGNANGWATANGMNGAAPYTYHWSNGQNTQTATGLAQGAYNVTVTDANNCSFVSYTNINAKLPPLVSITAVNTSCITDNGSATAAVSNGTSPFTYLWSNGLTTQAIANLPTGVYSVTVTDSNGCITTATTSVQYQITSPGIPINGLIAYYPFTGNAYDSSGHGNIGIVHNNVTLTTNRFGIPNSAYLFGGGTYDWIEVANNSLLNIGPNFTVSAWVYKESGSQNFVISKGRDINCGTWSLATNSMSVNGNCGLNTGNIADTPLNEWHMITGVLDSSSGKLRFYRDAQLLAEVITPTFIANNNYPVAIGRHCTDQNCGSSWPYPYIGKIDDIVIYNRVLSTNEIMQLYNVAGGNNNISVDLGNDTLICANQYLMLDAGEGYSSYLWSTGENTQAISLSNLSAGSYQYYVTVSACGASASDTVNVSVNALPDNAGILSGTTNVCGGQTSLTYTVPAIPNAVNYIWTLPAGFSGTSDTNSITVNVGTNAVSGNISVAGENSCGTGAASNLTITVGQLPDTAGSIIGAISVCEGQIFNYTVQPVLNADTYSWTLPSGANGSSNTNSISIFYDTASTSGYLTVFGTSTCGNGPASGLMIDVSQLPGDAGTINGPAGVCPGQSFTYTIPNAPYADHYAWGLPAGYTGNSSTNTITVNVDSSAGSGFITVYGYNTCGDGLASYIIISIDQLPGNAGPISGSSAVCPGSTHTYTVPAIFNAGLYVWTLPSGAAGTSSTNSIDVYFDTVAISGNMMVQGSSGCGNGPPSTQYVVVNPNPPAPTITQNGNVLISNSSVGNQWYNSSGLISGATGQSYTAPSDDDYYVILTISDCSSDTSNVIHFSTIGVNETGADFGIILYPNPAKDELFIQSEGSREMINFEISDPLGQLVYKSALLGKTMVDLRQLSGGVYLIRFMKGDTVFFRKFVKN